MLAASVFDTFESDGYVVTPAVFSASEILEIQLECERIRARSVNWTVLGVARDSARLIAFIKHDVFRRICASTIGPDVDLFFDGILHKPAHGGKELRWHQDSGFGRTDPAFVSCWVPLSEGSAAAGGLWVAPGSHLSGPVEHIGRPATEQEYAGQVSTTIPPTSRALDLALGQVAVLHSEFLHRTGANETGTDRLSYQCGFVTATARFLDEGLPDDHRLPVFR